MITDEVVCQKVSISLIDPGAHHALKSGILPISPGVPGFQPAWPGGLLRETEGGILRRDLGLPGVWRQNEEN